MGRCLCACTGYDLVSGHLRGWGPPDVRAWKAARPTLSTPGGVTEEQGDVRPMMLSGTHTEEGSDADLGMSDANSWGGVSVRAHDCREGNKLPSQSGPTFSEEGSDAQPLSMVGQYTLDLWSAEAVVCVS